MKGWVKDLIWFAGIVAALLAYSLATGVAWPIAVVSSYSMEPTMRVGDFVFLTGATCTSIQPGEVVVYVARNPMWYGNWIIHRVYQKQNSGGQCGLVTWGDNNPFPDQRVGEPLVSNNIVGKVLFTVPYIGVFPLVVRPQGIGDIAIAAWLGRLFIFGAVTYAFYLYFKAAEKKPKKKRLSSTKKGKGI
ncbi:signal peptidase I [Pyrobaculum aerophilum]|uniref:Signal peptidase I n=1 Tax=Pyrobaculum aerophilum TaxID=13773 RepID=A0A371R593_9CREN|nr:signal peptidase I [Pyrobaculum aerophilum]RFA94585.1 signal peptidase I [Pyrobaculum aerophilum]RFA99189.1 signal peptidase I [Pyrobaculum aerophilum]